MFLDTRVRPAIFALASFALVVLPVDSLGDDAVRMKSDKVLLNLSVSYKQPCEQLTQNEQNTNMQLQSYVEEPLDQLLKRVPRVERD